MGKPKYEQLWLDYKAVKSQLGAEMKLNKLEQELSGKQISQLQERIKELEADGKRLDWLEKYLLNCVGGGWFGILVGESELVATHENRLSIRQAIDDKAMEE